MLERSGWGLAGSALAWAELTLDRRRRPSQMPANVEVEFYLLEE